MIAVSRKDNEISQADVDRVVDAAKAVAIPMDREIIHVIPQEFIVDDQDGIKDPIGMCGRAARGRGPHHHRRGHLGEEHLQVDPARRPQGARPRARAAGRSHAVLGPDERDLGVALLDIGGGTTDVAVFFEGSIRHTAIVPLGGANVTNDIAIGLRTPIDQAERIKIEHGCALAALVQPARAPDRCPASAGAGDKRDLAPRCSRR